MFFSIATFLNATFYCSILVLLLWILLKKNLLITKILIKAVLLSIIIIIIKLIFPVELGITSTVASKHVLPTIYLIIKKPLLYIGEYPVSIKCFLYFIWIFGIVFYLSKMIIIYQKFKKSLHNLPEIRNAKIQNILDEINISNKNPIQIKILETNMVNSPMLFGIRHPIVLAPTIEFSDEDWYYILLHEFTHYIKHHLWFKIVTEFVCGIYWWNPIVFLFRTVVERFLEIHVDFIITKGLEEEKKIEYLECLLKVVKQNVGRQQANMGLRFGNPHFSFISQRFNIIMNDSRSKKKYNDRYIYFVFIPIFIFMYLSFTIIFEAHHIKPEHATYTFEIVKDTSFLVSNNKGNYDLYINNEYVATVNTVKDSFSDFKIYMNLEEAIGDKKIQ